MAIRGRLLACASMATADYVGDARLGGLQVLRLNGKVGDGVLQAVLQGAQLCADGVLGDDGFVQGVEHLLRALLRADVGTLDKAEIRSGGAADGDEIVVFVGAVASAEVDFQRTLRSGAGTVVLRSERQTACSGEVAVEQVDAVEVRGVGDPRDFRSHGLELGIDEQTLIRVVRAGGGLFSQLFESDELFVDDLQGAVRRLNHRDGVVGVADALVERCDVGAHELADGEPCGVVRSGGDAQAGRKALRGLSEPSIARPQVSRGVHSHHVVVNDQRHGVTSLLVAPLEARPAPKESLFGKTIR